jgi:RNA polymerase sigma factor (sigma-70 family)
MHDRLPDPGTEPGITSLLQAKDLPRVCLAAIEVAGWGSKTYSETIGTYATTLAQRDETDPTLVNFADNLDVIAACIGEHEPAPSSLVAFVGLVIIENTAALEFHPDGYYTEDMVQYDLSRQTAATPTDTVDHAHAALTELYDKTGAAPPDIRPRPLANKWDPFRPRRGNTSDPLKMYLNEIGSYPLLTAGQETALGKRVQAGLAAEAELDQLERLAPNAPRIQRLWRTINDGDDAHNEFTKANLRLVVSIAKRYTGVTEQLPQLDLIAEGNLGLMRAVDKFNPNKGFKFSTYATWWIRQAISQAIADQGRTIRTPVYMLNREREVALIVRELQQELNRDPTLKEIANKGKLSPKKVTQALQSARMQPRSLDAPFDKDNASGATLNNVVADVASSERQATALEGAEDAQEVATLLDLAGLDEREQVILGLRFGMIMPELMDNEIYTTAISLAAEKDGLTLEEISVYFGLSRERIRKIEKKALEKLRKATRQAFGY